MARRSERAQFMLHVPFELLKQADDRAAERLRREFGVRSEIAALIREHRFERPEDVFSCEQLLRTATPAELIKLVVPPRRSSVFAKPAAVRSYDARVEATSGALVGTWTSEDGRKRLFLAHPTEELISAELDGDQLQYNTVRFLGRPVWELPRIDALERVRARKVIHSPMAIRAGLLWRDNLLEQRVGDPQNVRRLSKVLRSLQAFTRPVDRAALADLSGGVAGDLAPADLNATVPAARSSPDEPGVDGCDPDWLPDFDLKSCCDAHDRCYISGCTACDRLSCDNQLYECIIRKGVTTGIPAYFDLALIFYVAVRTLGDSHFNYCDDPNQPVVTVPTLTTTVAGGLVGGMVATSVAPADKVALFVTPELATAVVVGALVGQVVGRVLEGVACAVCDWAERTGEVCREAARVERRECSERRERRRRRCRKKRHWWQRLACHLWAWLRWIACVVFVSIIEGACWAATTALKGIFCPWPVRAGPI